LGGDRGDALSSGASEGRRAILVFSSDGATIDEIGQRLREQGLPHTAAGTLHDARRAVRRSAPLAVVVDAGPELASEDLGKIIQLAAGAPVLILPRGQVAGGASSGGHEPGGDAGLWSSRSPLPAQLRVAAAVTLALSETLVRAGRVELDAIRHEVRIDGEVVWFTLKEFELLELLLMFQGRVLTPEFLLERVWGTDSRETRRTLYVHIRRIRQKVEPDPRAPRLLVTVRGRGYKFVPG
jgi:two-component system response regulator RegX3